MTAETPEEPPKRGTMNFRSSASKQPKLTREEARRQGEITQLAFQLMGGREGALAFLNHADDALEGRPLDVAIASDAGFVRVEQVIRQRTAARSERS
jgi:uncharacterized protein (DUF2384 family)